ncbi:unnamed protein product [Staurois parvus]|uniref:Uncharacterized protein n=1 Tax=Staurois parvus TaxID=386267 RepID=A0ABN9DRP0_9NEOB|nr:unnamed protein product [Staurois parvus]
MTHTSALLTAQPCWNREVAVHQPSLLHLYGPSRVAPEAPAASNICLLLCNGILAAALLIRCMDLAEIFLNVPLSAPTRLCSEISHKSLNSAMITLTFFVKYLMFSLPRPRH